MDDSLINPDVFGYSKDSYKADDAAKILLNFNASIDKHTDRIENPKGEEVYLFFSTDKQKRL